MKITCHFATFIVVGMVSAVVDLGSLYILILLGVGQYFAITAAFFIGLGFNLFLHARFTFKSALGIENVLRFLLVVGMNYAVTLCFVFASQHLGQNYIFGKVVSLLLVAFHGFLWSKNWAFRVKNP